MKLPVTENATSTWLVYYAQKGNSNVVCALKRLQEAKLRDSDDNLNYLNYLHYSYINFFYGGSRLFLFFIFFFD